MGMEFLRLVMLRVESGMGIGSFRRVAGKRNACDVWELMPDIFMKVSYGSVGRFICWSQGRNLKVS